jgi:hypothetical protein
MKKFMFLWILCAVISVSAAPEIMLYYDIFDNEPVAGAVTIYSQMYPLAQVKNFGVWFRATSLSGTPEISVGYEVCYDYDTAHCATPDRGLWIWGDNTGAGLTDTTIKDEIIHIEAFSPPVMMYLRYKIVGGAANPADTLVQMKAWLQ